MRNSRVFEIIIKKNSAVIIKIAKCFSFQGSIKIYKLPLPKDIDDHTIMGFDPQFGMFQVNKSMFFRSLCSIDFHSLIQVLGYLFIYFTIIGSSVKWSSSCTCKSLCDKSQWPPSYGYKWKSRSLCGPKSRFKENFGQG